METIKCPKCNGEVKIDISKAIDENGEVYQCPKCKTKIRFTNK